jgi:hypothetical protein
VRLQLTRATVGQQVSEVQMMQQHIMDLESRHTSMAQQ